MQVGTVLTSMRGKAVSSQAAKTLDCSVRGCSFSPTSLPFPARVRFFYRHHENQISGKSPRKRAWRCVNGASISCFRDKQKHAVSVVAVLRKLREPEREMCFIFLFRYWCPRRYALNYVIISDET